jgi:protein-tyrosine phosphatase
VKILVVCLGNICRSPIAEKLLQIHADAQGLDWQVSSAGTNRYHKGGPADPRSIQVCAQNGVDLESHIARRMTSKDFDHFDVILSLADEVTEEMQEFIRDEKDRKKIVGYLDCLGSARDVPDPYYGGKRGFQECYALIDQAAREWVRVGFLGRV